MSTADNKRSVIVGVFVLIGIAILVIGILTLGGQQKKFADTFPVKAVFDDVGGLREGNNVWFSGVKIGMITKVAFYGKSQVQVTMAIEEKVRQYIRKDAKASISSDGFIGDKLIMIYDGSQSVGHVEDGDVLKVVPALSTDQMMETFQVNNKNLVDITNNLKILTSKLVAGEGTLGAFLTDSAMADNIRAVIANLHTASVNAANISGELNNFTDKLDTEGSLVNEMLTDTSVFKDIKISVAQLKTTTETASKIALNLKQVSGKLKDDNSAIGLLLNDEEVAADLKETLNNLESSSAKLDENMEALQHNFLFRRYFKKKAKEDKEEEKSKEKKNKD